MSTPDMPKALGLRAALREFCRMAGMILLGPAIGLAITLRWRDVFFDEVVEALARRNQAAAALGHEGKIGNVPGEVHAAIARELVRELWYASWTWLGAFLVGLAAFGCSMLGLYWLLKGPHREWVLLAWPLSSPVVLLLMFLGGYWTSEGRELWRIRSGVGNVRVADQLVASFLDALGHLREDNPEGRDARNRCTGEALLRSANVFDNVAPYVLGIDTPDDWRQLRMIARNLRQLAADAVFLTKDGAPALRTKLAQLVMVCAEAQYGEISSICGNQVSQGTMPALRIPLIRRLAAAAVWFAIPIGIVVLVDVCVSGAWPAVLEKNWKPIVAGWALLSVAQGLRVDTSGIGNLIKSVLAR